MILDEADRSVTNNNGRCRDYDGNWLKDDDGNRRCYGDREKKFYTSAQWKGEGFYRLVEPAGTQIPEYAPGRYHCGTISTGWLNDKHPERYGEVVGRTVCVDSDIGNKRDCDYKRSITVTNCKGYYVYFLPNISNGRYCGANPN